MNHKIKIFLIAGARPNFMKIAPIYDELKKKARHFQPVIVHTGQHYDENMSKIFFEQLRLPQPDFYLGVGSGSHGAQTAELMRAIETLLIRESPEIVLVVGDVNSTLAAALVTKKTTLKSRTLADLWRCYEMVRASRPAQPQSAASRPQRMMAHASPILVHVEAGERSFDMSMPEEINRLETDMISDLLFTTGVDSDDNLFHEGVDPRIVYRVGNIMVDSLVRHLPDAGRSNILKELSLERDDRPPRYALATFHRPGNVDDPENLRIILAALTRLSHTLPVVFPVHPRTRQLIEGLKDRGKSNAARSHLQFIEPQGYIDFLRLQTGAALVLTDSGGVQVETSYLGVPCLTLRPSTEWNVTLEHGTNELVEMDAELIVQRAQGRLTASGRTPPKIDWWDGKTAARIVSVLETIAVGKTV